MLTCLATQQSIAMQQLSCTVALVLCACRASSPVAAPSALAPQDETNSTTEPTPPTRWARYAWYLKEAAGRTKATMFEADGVREGPFTFYLPSGAIVEIGMMRNGKEEGLWTFLRDDGKTIEYQCEYRAGVLNGYYVTYHPNGALDTVRMYVDGKATAVGQHWDDDGTPHEDGPIKIWDQWRERDTPRFDDWIR